MPVFKKLKKRSEFLEVRKRGGFIETPFFFLQVLKKNKTCTSWFFSLGVTASKKVGKAVKRNFAKRRLRNLFKEVLMKEQAMLFSQDHNYDLVLIAKKSLIKTPYKTLCHTFRKSLSHLSRK